MIMGLFVQRGDKSVKKKGGRIFGVIGMAICLLALVLALHSMYFGVVSQKNVYILEYRDEIARFSEEYQLDPHLICAMIYCESTFRSDAVSSVGAVGLMQIMPSTGEWLAGKLKIEGYTKEMLLRPSINVEMGCYYMNFLLSRYNGNIRSAVAAYHSGQGNVDEWLRNPAISDDGKNLQNIPEGETRKYTDRVMRVHDIYKKLYKDEFNI